MHWKRQLDLFADRLRKSAGIGPDQIVDASELAVRLIGPQSIVLYDRLACGARLRWTEQGYRIELRDGLPDINFACAHEIGHWALSEVERYEGPDEERYANYLGAALLAPHALVRAAVPFYGRGLEAVRPLAEAVIISQTAANLRLGEVLGDERVVVTRSGNVLRASEESFPEPDRQLVLFARAHEQRPGVAKAELQGGIDEDRVAMRAR